MERLTRVSPSIPGETPLDVDVREYLVVREQREKLAKDENKRKAGLMEALSALPTDDRGHVIHELPAPVGPVTGVQRQRRVSVSMDEDAAMALVHKYGLQDRCLETVQVLNEDALLAANFEGLIPDADIKALYSESESFALVLIKE